MRRLSNSWKVGRRLLRPCAGPPQIAGMGEHFIGASFPVNKRDSGVLSAATQFGCHLKDNVSAEAGIYGRCSLINGISSQRQQYRGFLGCGDGDEDTGLAKTYEERRVIGYSPEQLFSVVAAVDLYEDFVPWCQRSSVLHWNNSESFDAELEIGFKFLVERYVSHVELKKHHYIKTTASESTLFDYLINIWEFNRGPVPGTCDLHFFVDFQFRSPLYRQVANMFFKEVVSRLVHSFEHRCQTVYGPAVKILEGAYGSQKV